MEKIEKIKQLRQLTDLSITECKKALEEADFDLEKAKNILKARVGQLSEKRRERETKEGIVEAYIHSTKKVGVLLELLCESDFVAKAKEFQALAHEICLQIAAQNPLYLKPEEAPKEYKEEDKKEVALLTQSWIKDESKTIEDLLRENIAKFGENIQVGRFVRYEI